MKRPLLFSSVLAFVLTVWGANWALTRYGIITLPLVGLTAPAGVYFAGLAFGLRDVVHELGDRRWVLGAIAGGAALSFALEDGRFAIASGIAFALSELVDFAIYAPLREKQWPLAVVGSNLVGATVDTFLFLSLAGLPVADLWQGQLVGKWLMILPVLPLVWAVRSALRTPICWACDGATDEEVHTCR